MSRGHEDALTVRATSVRRFAAHLPPLMQNCFSDALDRLTEEYERALVATVNAMGDDNRKLNDIRRAIQDQQEKDNAAIIATA